MSVNKYNFNTGELVPLASGVRMWIGTKSAHDTAVANGTMPNNCIVCITDDYPTEDSEDITVTFGSFTAQNAYVKRSANVVQFYFSDVRDHSGVSVSSWTTIATIPDGYRPDKTVYDFCGGVNSQMLLQIAPSGKVQAYFNNNLDYEFIANVCYVTD